AIRIPTTSETTQCRLGLTSFDLAPFCAAPRPNQNRSLSMAVIPPTGTPKGLSRALVGPELVEDQLPVTLKTRKLPSRAANIAFAVALASLSFVIMLL